MISLYTPGTDYNKSINIKYIEAMHYWQFNLPVERAMVKYIVLKLSPQRRDALVLIDF